MKALFNSQQCLSPNESDPRPEGQQGDPLKKRLSQLLSTNKDREAMIEQLEKEVQQMHNNNKVLREQLQQSEQEWQELKQQQEGSKSSSEDEAEMNDWIQNVQKHNGLAPEAIDSLLTIEFEGGEHQICLACYSELAAGALCTYLPCAHLFHRECIVNHLKVNTFCLACQQPVQL